MNCIKNRSNPSNLDLFKISTEPENINQHSKTNTLTALQTMNYLYNKHFNEEKKTKECFVDLSQRTVTISKIIPGCHIENYILPDYKIPDEIINDPKGLLLD